MVGEYDHDAQEEVAFMCLLIVLAKHLLSDSYTPFDRGVEIGVFLLILYEVVMTSKDRWQTRRRLQQEEAGLDELSPDVQEELKRFVLGGPQPKDSSLAAIKEKAPDIIERRYVGPVVANDHKDSLRKWAAKK